MKRPRYNSRRKRRDRYWAKLNASPWLKEKEYEFFIDKETGYPCEIIRGHELMHLCGYVGVSSESVFYGQNWKQEPTESLDVHGGITYGCDAASHYGERYKLASFVVGTVHGGLKGGRSKTVDWWIGFDCAHAGDMTPSKSLPSFNSVFGGVYRDRAYVKEQLRAMCLQMRALDEEF